MTKSDREAKTCQETKSKQMITDGLKYGNGGIQCIRVVEQRHKYMLNNHCRDRDNQKVNKGFPNLEMNLVFLYNHWNKADFCQE